MKTMLCFFSEECYHSLKMQTDFYEFLAENNLFNIKVYDINADSKESKEWYVFATPTMIMTSNGKEYCRMVQSSDKDTLYDFYTHECENLKEDENV